MHLFDDLDFVPAEPRPLGIETPLGPIGSCAIVNGERLAEPNACFFALASGAWSARWELECGVAQVLVSRPLPGLELGYWAPLHGCHAFLWRFVAARKVGSLSFEARWRDGFRWTDGGPSWGQYLDAQTWDDKRVEVSLGTEDDDALFERSQRRDWLPQRYAQQSRDHEYLMLNRYFETGFATDFGAAEAGEKFAVYYAVAWADVLEDSIATWLAVDTSAKNILAGAST